MFPDANHFVIQGGTFYEHHIHVTSPSSRPRSPLHNSSSDLGERPTPIEVLPSGQYCFQNCEKAESVTNTALVHYLPGLPGVAEILETGFPGKAWTAKGNVCTMTERPSWWFFEQVSPNSEWFYIRPYDKPSKTLSGHCMQGSVEGDMFLEDLEHRSDPIHLFKPIRVDIPLNSGIVSPGYHYFQNIQTGVKTSLTYVQYVEDEFAVAVLAEVEMPGLYWNMVGNVCKVLTKPSEWQFETVQGEVGGTGIFYIYLREQPKHVVSGSFIEGSLLGDLHIQARKAPEPSLLHLWKAISVDLPENSGILPAGIYKFINIGTKAETNAALVEYSNKPGCIGRATLSVVSCPGTYWVSTEAMCTGGSEPSEWFFQCLERNVYYICPCSQPYPMLKVVSGETVDGEPDGDYLIQDKNTQPNNVSALNQAWVALKQ